MTLFICLASATHQMVLTSNTSYMPKDSSKEYLTNFTTGATWTTTELSSIMEEEEKKIQLYGKIQKNIWTFFPMFIVPIGLLG